MSMWVRQRSVQQSLERLWSAPMRSVKRWSGAAVTDMMVTVQWASMCQKASGAASIA